MKEMVEMFSILVIDKERSRLTMHILLNILPTSDETAQMEKKAQERPSNHNNILEIRTHCLRR